MKIRLKSFIEPRQQYDTPSFGHNKLKSASQLAFSKVLPESGAWNTGSVVDLNLNLCRIPKNSCPGVMASVTYSLIPLQPLHTPVLCQGIAYIELSPSALITEHLPAEAAVVPSGEDTKSGSASARGTLRTILIGNPLRICRRFGKVCLPRLGLLRFRPELHEVFPACIYVVWAEIFRVTKFSGRI